MTLLYHDAAYKPGQDDTYAMSSHNNIQKLRKYIASHHNKDTKSTCCPGLIRLFMELSVLIG